MTAQIGHNTGFRFIDTYNNIRGEMEAGLSYEEELDTLDQQQEVPQFFSSTSSPSAPFTVMNHQNNNNNNNQSCVLTPTPTPSPPPPRNNCHTPTHHSFSPSPSPCYSPAPATPPPPPPPSSYTPPPTPAAPTMRQLPLGPQSAETQQVTSMSGTEMIMMTSSNTSAAANAAFVDQTFQALLDMDVSNSFLEELIMAGGGGGALGAAGSQDPPTTFTTLTPVVQPPQTLIRPPVASLPPSSSSSSSNTTTYVSENAGAGCTVVQQTAAAAADDQQIAQMQMDMVDFCDLDRQGGGGGGGSFYDDFPADPLLKETSPPTSLISSAGDWAGCDLSSQGSSRSESSSGSLTELGVIGSAENEDLLNVFDSLRRDILLDCRQLSISPDPKAWSASDSQSWVTYMLDKSQRADDCSTPLAVPGPALCQKSESEFARLSPMNGAFLHQQIHLWLAVADLPAMPAKSSQQQQPQQTFTTTSPQYSATYTPHLPPSVSPAPSTDSVCNSEQSSLSSSSSSSSSSDVEMTQWSFDTCDTDDLFHDSAPSSKTTPSTTTTTTTTTKTRQVAGRSAGKQIRLWEFLRELLDASDASIKWLDRQRGVFKIEDSNRVARLWGQRKNHPAMNYDKLSRSVRQYYKKGIIKKTTQTRRLVYQFCERYL